MIKVTKIKTFDDCIFDTEKEAINHLEVLYANKLLPLAHKLNHKGFNKITEIIDTNLETFIKMKQIRNDQIMRKNEDE